jgi:hypothetical protein
MEAKLDSEALLFEELFAVVKISGKSGIDSEFKTSEHGLSRALYSINFAGQRRVGYIVDGADTCALKIR